MALLLIIGLVGLTGVGLILLVVRVSANPNVITWKPWALSILAGYGLAYLIGLIWVSFNPIWKTGDVEIWAEFPEHLAWAVPVMAYAQLVCIPLTVAGHALYRRLRLPT